MWSPAIAAHEVLQFFMRNARQQSWIVDLVTIQMEDGQYCAIPNRVQKFADVPGGRQWAGLRFAVTDDGCDNQVGIVECRAAGVGEYVSQFTPFMDRAGSLGCAMTSNSAGEGELSEEIVQTLHIFR